MARANATTPGDATNAPTPEDQPPQLMLTAYEKFREPRWGMFCQSGAAPPVVVGEWWNEAAAVKDRAAIVTTSGRCKACKRPYRDHIIAQDEPMPGGGEREGRAIPLEDGGQGGGARKRSAP